MNEKKCLKCKKTKPIDEFGLRNKGKYRRSYCKQCEAEESRLWRLANPERQKHLNRRNGLRLGHGITLDVYEALFKAQHGKCAICGKQPKGKRPLAVDHNHHTQAIRGLLCDACNIGIGMLQEDVVVLKAAIGYLEERNK